jgi:hypothetical protein
MDRPEYIHLPMKLIPEDTIQHYNLKDKVEDGWVYINIVAGMYGLPMTGKLANELLKRNV